MRRKFLPDCKRVLFFSRGRGRGHAIPDIAIKEKLCLTHTDTDVLFVSYGTGANTFAELGHPVIDLELPEENPFLETLVRASSLIGELHPQLVVSHEEFAVLPAAKSLSLPTVFITDWFVRSEHLIMNTLEYADEIIFLEQRGIFEEPPFVKDRIHYVGPIVRPMNYSKSDRTRAREELNLPHAATILSVIPGGWATEKRAPIFDLLVPAFDALNIPDKLLIWNANEDYEILADRLKDHLKVIVQREYRPVERLMVASDLVITKANRGTIMDLCTLSIPSISISWGLNPIDELVVPRIRTNTAFNARAVDADFLAECITNILESVGDHRILSSGRPEMGGAAAAHQLANSIDKIGYQDNVKSE